MIATGEKIRLEDYINASEKTGSDEGKCVKLENTNKLDTSFTQIGVSTVVAAEPISVGSGALAVFIDTDGKAYLSDKGAGRNRFSGFAIETANEAGDSIRVQTHGIINRFSGLIPGRAYYIQNSGIVSTGSSAPNNCPTIAMYALTSTTAKIEKGFRYFVDDIGLGGDLGAPDSTTLNVDFLWKQIRLTGLASHYRSGEGAGGDPENNSLETVFGEHVVERNSPIHGVAYGFRLEVEELESQYEVGNVYIDEYDTVEHEMTISADTKSSVTITDTSPTGRKSYMSPDVLVEVIGDI